MSQYAAEKIAAILDSIQLLHAEARRIADEHEITFDLELEGGRNYNVTAEYEPGYSWNSSNC